MKKIFLIALLAVALSSSSNAQKYAIIDTKFILSKMPEYVDADKKLQQISEQWQKEIDNLQTQLNEMYKNYSEEQVQQVIEDAGLQSLLTIFENGLQTKVTSGGDNVSLGQKQLIAFMRAVLRNPEILILDEATANIDTVTEQLLEEILNKLPKSTTRIIIAHRLNTIENADEIFFVNAGEVIRAGSFTDAVDKLLHNKRVS